MWCPPLVPNVLRALPHNLGHPFVLNFSQLEKNKKSNNDWTVEET